MFIDDLRKKDGLRFTGEHRGLTSYEVKRRTHDGAKSHVFPSLHARCFVPTTFRNKKARVSHRDVRNLEAVYAEFSVGCTLARNRTVFTLILSPNVR